MASSRPSPIPSPAGASDALPVPHVLALLERAALTSSAISTVHAHGSGSSAAPGAHEHLAPARAFTYGDLLRAARAVARVHGARGSGSVALALAPRRPVLVYGGGADHWPALVGWWACVVAGAVPCPLPAPHPDAARQRDVLRHLAELFEGPTVLTTREDRHLFDGAGLRVEVIDGEAEMQEDDEESTVQPPKLDDVATFMLTSGSTGMPKATELTHRNLLSSICGKAAHFGTCASDVYLNWISADHVACLTEVHLAAMLHGAPQHHVAPLAVVAAPRVFASLLASLKVSYTFAPNFLLAKILREVEAEGASESKSEGEDGAPDLSALRVLVSGGEAVPLGTARRVARYLQRCGAPPDALVAGFGMTETCAGSIYNLTPRLLADSSAHDAAAAAAAADEYLPVGTPTPCTQVRIARDGASTHPDPDVGELHVSGPNITRGYYRNADATADASTPDGWFRTGDLARLTPNGKVLLVGRGKELLNINGVKTPCAAVEQAIESAALPNVESSYTAACPLRLPHSDSETYIVVFLPQDADATSAPTRRATHAIRAIAAAACAGHAPHAVLPLARAQLAKTALGKLSRAKIAAEYLAGAHADLERRLAAPAGDGTGSDDEDGPAEPQDADEARLVEIVRRIAGEDGHAGDAGAPSCTRELVEYVASSIALMRLRLAFARALDCTDAELPAMALFHYPTIRKLVRHVRACKASAAAPKARAAVPKPAPAHEPVPAPEYDPVVRLSTSGAGTPLWCCHPGLGEVLVFVGLARLMRGQRPVYALRARGLGAEGRPKRGSARAKRLTQAGSFTKLEDMVDCYVEAIVKTQPQGPYALLGYSYGGVISFEIAKQLQLRGADVRFAGFMNIPPSISWRMKQLDWMEIAIHMCLFLDLFPGSDLEGIAQRIVPPELQSAQRQARATDSTVGSARKYFRGRSAPLSEALKAETVRTIVASAASERAPELALTAASLKQWLDVAHDLATLAKSYAPSGRLGPRTATRVFVAEPLPGLGARHEYKAEHLDAWAQYAESLEMLDVEGSHYTMLANENVHSFHALLTAQLAQVGI